MNIVVDTNIFLAVALNEPSKGSIIRASEGATIVSPEILPYEVGNALSALVKRNRLSHPEAVAALSAIQDIPVRLAAVEVRAALELALQHSIYAYDAYFLQCAVDCSWPLLSLDKRLLQVARQIGVPVLEVGQ